MANLPDAKKRVKQQERNRTRNKARKGALKAQTRRFLDAMHDGDTTRATEQFRLLTKKLDQVAAKGTLHRNTAARKKSRLAKQLNTAKTKTKG
ncbi:MAG: 30S ribosomal protein S20 [Planctomycetota bacterium]